jgi:hypothetical protein
MSVDEYGSSPPDHSTRHRPFFCERADAIGSDHTVFEISTIDASHCRRQAACDFSQVTAGFTDEPSLTAMTEHMSSFYFLRCGLRQRTEPTSASAPPCSSMLHFQLWSGNRLGINEAPRLSRWHRPPDPLNHTHSRRPDLRGEVLGMTEPLDRSQCRLFLVVDRQ